MATTTAIYLKRRDLAALAACPDGLALFDELAALQGRKCSLRLTWAHLLWLLADETTREYAAWAQGHGLLPRINLNHADLSGVDLHGAILVDADLSGANLSHADLSGVDLHGAFLSDADLRDADLRDADLCGADLCGADLCGAGLHGAYLRGADLCDADLCGANLSGADLRIANLRNANLHNANLRNARFDGCFRLPSDPTIPGWAVRGGTLVRDNPQGERGR